MSLRKRAAFCLAVFLVVAGVYIASPVTTSYDSQWFLHEAISLVRRGNLDLNEYRRVVPPGDYRVLEVKGALRSFFPPGTVLLAAPLAGMADLASGGDINRRLQVRKPQPNDRMIEKAIASVLVAGAAALFFLLALECGLALAPALAAAAAFSFATPAWSLASRGLWQHGPLMLLLTAALLLLTAGERHARWVTWSAAPLAFGFIVRPTAALALAAFAGAILARHPRRFAGWIAVSVAILVPFALWSHRTFDEWLPPYYGAGRLTLHPAFGSALLANLVSPARGLFVYAPVVLLAGAAGMVGARRWTAVQWAAACAALSWWPLVSAFHQWWAGHAYGPRFLTDTLPLLLYLALPAFGRAFRDTVSWRRNALAGALALTVGWGLFVNARGATSWAPWRWNAEPMGIDRKPSRVWDWSDPQFLR